MVEDLIENTSKIQTSMIERGKAVYKREYNLGEIVKVVLTGERAMVVETMGDDEYGWVYTLRLSDYREILMSDYEIESMNVWRRTFLKKIKEMISA